MSTITISQVKKMGLEIQNLENMLDIERSGGVAVPYIGYIDVNLTIPEIKAYEEDLLMMVMNDSRYGDIIPFVIGTIHIQSTLEVITDDEWTKLGTAFASKADKMENLSLDVTW